MPLFRRKKKPEPPPKPAPAPEPEPRHLVPHATSTPVKLRYQATPLPKKGEVPEDEKKSSGESVEIDKLVSAFSLLIYNTLKSLWMSVDDLRSCIDSRFPVLISALEKHGEVRITLLSNNLLVNGIPHASDDRYFKTFVRHLAEIGASNFAIDVGIDEEEFMRLLDVLCMTPEEIGDEGFIEKMRKQDLKHVVVKNIKLKEVSEDELVVDRDLIDEDGVEQLKKAETSVLELLSLDRHEHTAESVADMSAITKDAGKMAEVIFDATDARHAAAEGEGGGGGDGGPPAKSSIMVDCLERAFEALMRHPSFMTQRGKTSVKKTLNRLEKELISRLGRDPDAEEMKTHIVDAMTHMKEGLKTARIASEYTKKLKSLQDSETKILRFIKSQGIDRVKRGDLEKQLNEGGLDVSGWHKLLARSVVEQKAKDADADAAMESEKAVGNLATLLDALDEHIAKELWKKDTDGADQLTYELKEVNEQVSSLTEITAEKIKNLVSAFGADLDEVEAQQKLTQLAGAGPLLTRVEVAMKLSEIVRELVQPLGLVRCSVDMVMSNAVGETNERQREMLKMAAEGAERIKQLIQDLEQISGVVVALYPAMEGAENAKGESPE